MNEIINAAKSGKGAGNQYRKMKMVAELLIFVAAKKSQIKPFNGPVHIHYEWVERNKRRDLDNISAARKFINDILRKMGILAGDGWKHVQGLSETFQVNKDRPGVIVTIQDV